MCGGDGVVSVGYSMSCIYEYVEYMSYPDETRAATIGHHLVFQASTNALQLASRFNITRPLAATTCSEDAT